MRVRFTATAYAEAEEILRHIANDNPIAAAAVGVAIKAALARLRLFPRIGAETDHPGILLTIVQPYHYLLFYRIDREGVIVRNIRHPVRLRPPAESAKQGP